MSLQVAGVARVQWKEIALYLGFKVGEIDDYALKEPDSLKMRLVRVLNDWKCREFPATIGALLAACEKAQVGGAVKRALQTLQKDNK